MMRELCYFDVNIILKIIRLAETYVSQFLFCCWNSDKYFVILCQRRTSVDRTMCLFYF